MIRGVQGAAILAAAIAAGFPGSAAAVTDTPKTVQVDCNISGKTINKALEKGKEDRSLIVQISGVCNENVVVDRADVTLRGGPGAAINGSDASLSAVEITADRVAIEGLVVSGGLNGIVASGAGSLAVRGTTVQSTGRTGVIVQGGSGATFDGSTFQLNPRDGIAVDGSQLTIINSTVSQNARFGIFIGNGAAGRIGLDNANNAGGNTVSQNGATGINVGVGGAALIGHNSITFNGTDPASTAGRSGIQVSQGAADLIGGNTIANNAGQGISMRSAAVQIGNTAFSPTLNTISGNGNPTAQGGVFATLGSSLVIRDAVITGNQGLGLSLTTRSVAQITNTQIQGTISTGPGTGDGIRLTLGGALLPLAPASSVTGNAGAGLACFGGSAVNIALLGIAGNGTADTLCGVTF